MTCSEISRVCRHAMNFVTLFFLVMHNSKFVAVDEDDGIKSCVCVCVCVCVCCVERGLVVVWKGGWVCMWMHVWKWGWVGVERGFG